ncbi:Z band alternatively spliced PDZ-motif protein 52 isoform X3 [Brevipalpus obovatus]|uniref:Z band alternatively spliced PDZ-motif protein 52 isoform X3 n=1 Tax=Brevipalpus obovatus TaxID=246614 RepID=UPI003D9F376C
MAGQLITVRMCRGDALSPWGFRLQGGKDWGTPLAISKLNPGSLAEQAGLQLGDFVIKIANQSAEHMLHHEAQDAIKCAMNNLDLQVQRGGTLTWKPSVTPIGDIPRPGSVNASTNFTRTSLARNTPDSRPIGTGHNVKPKPFAGAGDRMLVHKQFNSPINLYSEDNIKEALDAHTEQLAPGVMGINFMKPDAPVNKQSAVYQAILEEEQNQREVRPGIAPQSQPRSPSPAPGGNYHPSSVIKHVDAPTTRPGQSRPQESSLNTCGQCGGLITGVFCRIKDKNLHPECFKCSTCGTSLKNIGYFNINDKLYCDTHARQAATLLSPTNHYDPMAIRPGAQIPRDAGIVGVGGSPPPPKPGSPRIEISSPSLGHLIDRPSSPAVLGAIPWHQQSPSGIHHVDAPTSPRAFQSSSPVLPQTAPKPQYTPISPPNQSLYQPQPQPYAWSDNQSNQTGAGGSKFTWPPKQSGTNEYSSTLPGYRPAPGTQQQRLYESSQFSSNANTSFSGMNRTTNNSNYGSTPPNVGASSLGSRSMSRRGLGQLKPQGSHGARIPICAQCGSPIRGPFILAVGKTWCPEHFNCANPPCRRPLQDIGFVEERGQLFCANCFVSHFAPNCSKCGLKVKEDCLVAIDKHWHPSCFACGHCQRPIGSAQFYMEDGRQHCESCWNQLYTTKCIACNFPIEPGDRWVEALNNNYHSQCFRCSICSRNLEGESFYAKGGRPFCKSHAR